MNKWDEMRQAVNEAKMTIQAADSYVDDMAQMICGRLRKSGVGKSTLNELKRELAKWDMCRGVWK